MKPEIIYIYDPLCGWCYGFSEIIKQLKEKYENDFKWTVLSGGMVIGANVTTMNEISEYISEAIPVVEKKTGVVFGESFKQILNSDYEHNSLLPSIATTVFKEMKPDKTIEFIHSLQKAFFYYGKNLNDLSTYQEIISRYNINNEEFFDKFSSEEYKDKTYLEFQEVQKLRIDGFPYLLIKKDDKYSYLTRGFQVYRKLDEFLKRMT